MKQFCLTFVWDEFDLDNAIQTKAEFSHAQTKRLDSSLRCFDAPLLASDFYPLCAYVLAANNPADKPSGQFSLAPSGRGGNARFDSVGRGREKKKTKDGKTATSRKKRASLPPTCGEASRCAASLSHLAKERTSGAMALAKAQGRVGMVLALLVAFHCMLRGAEVRAFKFVYLCLRDLACFETLFSQSGRGVKELVTVTDLTLTSRLDSCFSSRLSNEQFEQLSHSLFFYFRQSGAIRFIRCTGDMTSSLERGRWACVKIGRLHL